MVTAVKNGKIVITERVNFQLITKRNTMFPIIVTKFFNKKVKLLLTADLAWFISLPSRLVNYPDLYC